jgi:DNA-binding PucR family transcriptional regulator
MLHPNTLRYRLRRAQDVSGLDLTDSLQSLVAQLHFCRTD